MKSDFGKKFWVHCAINVFVGAFIGIGAILPGLSGGVMCVLFGIYQPLMETLSHPIRGIKKHWKLLIPTAVGIAIGFVGFSGILDWLIGKDALLMQCVFLGLVLGTLPSLWKEADGHGSGVASWLVFALMFIFMVFVLSFLANDESTQMAKLINKVLPQASFRIEADFVGYIVVGVCFALSMVMPGMSFSSPLMCFGLFTPMTQNFSKLKDFADFDFSLFPNFILPIGIGALVTIIALAKPMNMLFEKSPSVGYRLVMGAVFASTFLLIPTNFNESSPLWCIVAIVGGFAAGYALDIVQSKVKKE